jgi:hypothetical protein
MYSAPRRVVTEKAETNLIAPRSRRVSVSSIVPSPIVLNPIRLPVSIIDVISLALTVFL